ncbi:MAG: SWIM zinc finger family protein [Myxococcales bacterium]|nr:SWIM zinc finger family protein [Myxococcales bacterium]
MAGARDPMSGGGEGGAREALQRLLAAFDDAAYEALASRGLLRRARKDLTRLVPELLREDDQHVVLRVDDAEVSLPVGGPAQARCSCPSPRCCRHVLAACLFLSGAATDDAPQPRATLRDELAALDEAALAAALGRRAVEAGHALLAEHEARVELDGERGARVVFDDLFRDVRTFAGAGLDGMLPPRVDNETATLHAAAILRLREQLGLAAASDAGAAAAATAVAAPSGAPRDRGEVVGAAMTLLCSVVRAGLTHASRGIEQRLTTLAVSCQGVRLPRLGRALEIAARELRALRRREAQASERRLFDQLSRTYALCRALDGARRSDGPWPAALVGRARRRYVAVPRVDLVGLGATSWRTKSGYEGLTVYLFETNHQRVLTWVDARPQDLLDWTARDRYRQAGPYPGLDGGPQRLCRSRLTLFSARVAPGRLSGSASSHALVHGPADPRTIALGERCLRDFSALEQLTAQIAPAGLTFRDPHAEIVLVAPASFGACRFDKAEQRLDWSLRDAAGHELAVFIDYEPHRERSIEQLESIASDSALLARVRLILARLAVRVDGPRVKLCCEPLSLWLDAPELADLGHDLRLINLGLDDAAPAATTSSAARAPRSTPEGPSHDDEPDALDTPDDDETQPEEHISIDPRVAHLEDLLERIAERGIPTRGLAPQTERELATTATALASAGFTRLANATASISSAHSIPDRLLAARYVCQLHRQATLWSQAARG